MSRTVRPHTRYRITLFVSGDPYMHGGAYITHKGERVRKLWAVEVEGG